MSEEDQQALAAARLYGADKTFGQIGEELEVSKSHAQVLTRRGINLMEAEKSESSETPPKNPGITLGLEERTHSEYPFNLPQDPRRAESYMLETSGIPKRIVLTPKALMIFNIWTNSGFVGDLSDFLEDAVIYLYETRQPANRGNFR